MLKFYQTRSPGFLPPARPFKSYNMAMARHTGIKLRGFPLLLVLILVIATFALIILANV